MNFFYAVRRWRLAGASAFLLALAAGCGGASKDGAPAKLNGAQEEAAKRMVAAAQAVNDAWTQGLPGKPASLVNVDMQIEWSRNLANAQVLLTPAGPGRSRALQGHLDRVSRIALPAEKELSGPLQGYREDLDYAIAQAQFTLAAEGVGGGGEMTGAMQQDAQRMVKAAAAAYDALLRVINQRPREPEFFELRIAWSRRRVRAESLIQATAVKRLPVMEAHIKRMNGAGAWVEGGAEGGTGKSVLRSQAAYGAAEAEFMAEANGAAAGQMTPEGLAAASQMMQNAEAVENHLQELRGVRPRTLEGLNLELLYWRKWAEAGMALHGGGGERKKMLAEYVKRVKEVEVRVKGERLDVVSPAAEGMAAYAVAEGEYWVASEK